MSKNSETCIIANQRIEKIPGRFRRIDEYRTLDMKCRVCGNSHAVRTLIGYSYPDGNTWRLKSSLIHKRPPGYRVCPQGCTFNQDEIAADSSPINFRYPRVATSLTGEIMSIAKEFDEDIVNVFVSDEGQAKINKKLAKRGKKMLLSADKRYFRIVNLIAEKGSS